jgi:hypothetical protein
MSIMETTGLDELMKDINDTIERFPEKRKRFHDKSGKIIAKNVQKHTPYDPSRKKGTHLVDAIYAKTGSGGGYTAVRADSKKAPHAHLVNDGHVQTDHDGVPVSPPKFIKGKHMFEMGLAESESELYTMADELAIEIAGDLE